jgi:hypothetical protein
VGIEIRREQYDDEDRALFADKLQRSLNALRSLVARPGFGAGQSSIGAELELDLVGDDGRPLPINRQVLAEVTDPRVSLEVDRFNLEINALPSALAGTPFTHMSRQLGTGLAEVRRAARIHGAHAVIIGILPTLRETDLARSALTDARRYRALSNSLRRIRGEPFSVLIEGDEALRVTAEDVTFEGANTSFQVHLRVAQEDFAATYNAAQIATAFALAASCNSPFFLGRRLWQETRVALFRQSVDDRTGDAATEFRPARVSFGHGWLRRSGVELFAESVAMHEPLLPELGPEDPEAVVAAGGVPAFDELRLHHGTVWRWNRAVYDNAGSGHMRIEMRALPSGPTVCDMTANAALLIGLTLGLARDAESLLSQLTFGHARRNFYEAAQRGLDAELLWPTAYGASPQPTSVMALAPQLLALAREGLIDGGVTAGEADLWLGVVGERLERKTCGATWQREAAARHERSLSREGALEAMLREYREFSENDAPVHTWSR